MNSEDIIRLAREAGYGWSLTDMHAPALERFATLVAAHEREALVNLAKGFDFGDGLVAIDDLIDAMKQRGVK